MTRPITAKSILSSRHNPDPWFGISYTMNLYRGCQHQCIYCDSRSECYQLGNLTDIRYKENAIDLLQRELPSKRIKGTIGTGSMNDPYMPAEKELQITRRALQLIDRHQFPLHIITKGTLVLRDADIIQNIARTYAAVSFTITTGDDALAAVIEPAAPPPSSRFETCRILSGMGIYTGITMMPLLPFVNDTEENLREIISRAAEAGAQYIIPLFGVTLRDAQREWYYGALDRAFPGLTKQYIETYGDTYLCRSTHAPRLEKLFTALCDEYGIATKMKFYLPPPPESEQLALF